jgi:predicted MPP superfamily phosphohydrolase
MGKLKEAEKLASASSFFLSFFFSVVNVTFAEPDDSQSIQADRIFFFFFFFFLPIQIRLFRKFNPSILLDMPLIKHAKILADLHD